MSITRPWAKGPGWGQMLVPGDMQELGIMGEMEASWTMARPISITGAQVAPGFAFIRLQWKLEGQLLRESEPAMLLPRQWMPGSPSTPCCRPPTLCQLRGRPGK